jgi:hypothetical protein
MNDSPADRPARAPGRITPTVRGRSLAEGDAPDELLRRYLVDPRGGGGLGYYARPASPQPAFRDLGRQLVSARSDGAALRDMMAIARHRRWSIVKARGSASFRREAWIAGRMAGVEVRGWRPAERDLRLLEQRTQERAVERSGDGPRRQGAERAAAHRPNAPLRDEGARALFTVIETVVRRRIAEPQAQEKILARVQARIDDWLQRGARFEFQVEREVFSKRRRERQR